MKHGVALTGRNTTGQPSRAAAWSVTLHICQCYRRQPATMTDASKRYTYMVCRRARNNRPLLASALNGTQ